MKATTHRLLTLLPWLSPPLVAAVYLALWDRIPERLAVHFGTDGTPNGWMTRGESLAIDLALLLFILVTSTFRISRKAPAERGAGRALLLAAVAFVTLVFLGLLKYNVTGSLF
jgi:nitric oxide reductase large subunit